MDIQKIQHWADQQFKTLVDTRRHLHRHPELSQQELNTQRFILDFLEAEGVPCREIASTGVLAWVEGRGDGKVVAIRADIDALPITEESTAEYRSQNNGVMHACGHDAHTAIALGCAKYFARHRDEFSGTVKFFFQPAEETVGGADRMIREGCMTRPDVDYVIGLHMMPSFDYNQIEIRYCPLNASTNDLLLTVKGKGGHGAYPDKGVDAVVIAAQIIVALQTIISRNVSPLDPAVITLGSIHGGSAGNVLADEVVIKGTVRTASEETKKVIFKKVRDIAASVAESMGGGCHVELREGYPALINDRQAIGVVEQNARDYLGENNVLRSDKTSMGGEDFSFFCHEAKGAFYNLGCRIQEREPYILHTKQFDIDERCLKTGVVLQVMNALALLG